VCLNNNIVFKSNWTLVNCCLQLELQRLLEHCLWESRCIDTESLCITTGRRVWTIRVDVHVLNYDGNVIDAASVAAIAALLHFRRPDVSTCGEDFVIHSHTER